MSVPPLVDPPVMPTVVSRLPKPSLRPKSASVSSDAQTGPTATVNTSSSTNAAAASSRLTNGFYHHPGPTGVNSSLPAPPSSVKQNRFIRVPTSFSIKWRKENVVTESGGADGEREWRRGNVGQNHQHYSQWQQGSAVVSQRNAKRPPTSSAAKGRGLVQTVTTSSSASPQSGPRTLPVSRTGFLSSKPSQTAPGLTNSTKQTVNSLSGSKAQSGTTGSLRRPQSFAQLGGSSPGSQSSFPLQKKLPASRSQSIDSPGSAPSIPLIQSDRLRSRSFTQVREQLSPALTPSSTTSSLPHSPTVTCSYSINRVAEWGFNRPPASSAQAPPSGILVNSSVGSQTHEGGGGGVRVQRQSLATLKKPFLPNPGTASKPSGISYKLSRPSSIKQSHPLWATPTSVSGGDQEVNLMGWRSSVETRSSTENSPESSPEDPEIQGLTAEPVSQAEVSTVGETLEDMSLSSTSSLDRNDTSQEYMDDFDNLGNGGIGILLFSSKNDEDDSGLDQSCVRYDDDKVAVNSVTKGAGLCFLDEGMDWADMRLSGERAEHRLTRLSHRRSSSQPDYHDQGGSSLDLSPSDSCGSGGTYMWDEEGLEPLGGPATTISINSNSNTTHHIGSFDSDLNSVDIVNNLDSCDLDDDDLMLDEDFASLHSDGDGMSHMARWGRRQLCWGVQDDSESDFQCYKLTDDPGNKRTDTTGDGDLVLDLRPPRSPCLTSGTPALGVDVQELVEDCSAVRSQLEHLQRLLLQEEDLDEDTLTTDAVSPEADTTSHSSDTQVQALLQEVQQLREELKSRDRAIAHLTLQLTVPMATTRCRCQETTGRIDRYTQTSVTERESVASQTLWTEPMSQILHSSSQEDQEPLTDWVPAPANPCPTQPEIPAAQLPHHPDRNTTDPTTQRGEDSGKRQRKMGQEKGEPNERRGASIRSLQLPQPSKLRLFLTQTSRQASSSGSASAATTSSKARVSSQLSSNADRSRTFGFKLKSQASTVSSSHLPKAKGH